jgi:hypothetical protein
LRVHGLILLVEFVFPIFLVFSILICYVLLVCLGFFCVCFCFVKKKNELSYRIHLKFNLSDTHISWKGYLIGSLTPKINIHLMAYKKKQTVWKAMENSLVVLHLLGKKQETCFWWYHTQIGVEQSQQTQFDIFHTKMLQNTSRCHGLI